MAPDPLLFVDHAAALGGAQYYLLDLFDHLDAAAFALHLAAPPGPLARAATARGVTVHALPLDKLRHQPAAVWRVPRTAVRMAALVRREHIAAVISNTMRSSLYAAPSAALAGRPHVWHVHDLFSERTYARAMLACSRAAIAVSASAAARLPPSRKINVIANGVRVEAFATDRAARAAIRGEWGIPADAVVIGQVARLVPWKGQRDLLAAAGRLLAAHPAAHVVLVGGDIFHDAAAYERELRALVAQSGLAPRVRLMGHREDIPAVLNALDVVVHASTDEPFGRILIEAGAAGLPVVAYASGAVAEIVVPEETGVLVAPGDVAALAAAIGRVAADPVLARRLGENGRRRVAAHYDVRRVVAEVASVYRAVLAGA